ncbi:MAG TPA: TlpA disulfide reductase family protein, partial [Thermomicrobiales bacterium]|nr:TlpA disulfide reductase family protein [Thermomicrobiales bacterium]
ALVAYQGDAVLGGHQARFADVFTQGRPVVLNFWAGDCPACQAEMPAFQRVADQERGRVIVVGLDVGTFTALGSHDSARQLMADLRITYPTAYAVDDAPLRLYHVLSIPTTVFLTAHGRVVTTVSGAMAESQLRAGVQQLLAGAP